MGKLFNNFFDGQGRNRFFGRIFTYASRPSLNLSARSELLDGHMKNIISDLDDHKKCRSSELTQEDKYSECTHTTLTATSKLSGMYFLVMLQFMWNNYGPQTTPTILFFY